MLSAVKRLPSVALLATSLGGWSCGPSAHEGGFDSANPAAKLFAIERAAEVEDRSPATLRRIVEQLASDDPAVRLVAIGALERLTGENHGYHHDEGPIERRAAIRRWVRYLEDGGATVEAPPRDRWR